MLEKHLKQLSEDLEMDSSPSRDEKGQFQLDLSPTISVTLKDLEPGALLLSKLAPCPTGNREELFTLLMRANFLGQGTRGGVIALEPDEKFLTLSLVIPYDMNFKAFKESVEDFVNILDYWREELTRFQTTG